MSLRAALPVQRGQGSAKACANSSAKAARPAARSVAGFSVGSGQRQRPFGRAG